MPAPHRDLQRLLDEEPFVRDLARQLVAGDADEVVQRTWLCAVQQGGDGVERPRHWLARVLRNVVANLRRDRRRRTAREAAAAIDGLVPSSQELAQREECRRALVAAVDALPTPLRTVVLLRWFDGKAPREIAAALGVPAATVSTQLQRALVLLRQRLDADHGGDRRAWMLPLVPFALRPELLPALPALPLVGAPAAPALLLGVIAMTTKTKLAAAAALALAAGSWWLLDGLRPPTPTATKPDHPPAATAQRGSFVAATNGATPTTAREREAAPLPAAATAPTTGTVIARLVRNDGSPVPDTMIALRQRDAGELYAGVRLRTDAAGTARFDQVTPGRLVVACDIDWGAGKRFELAAGQILELVLPLAAGLEVHGIVVDPDKRPVAGALVELALMGRSDAFPEVVAVTGVDGRFVVRDCPELCLVGARSRNHVASNVRFLHGKAGNRAEVELVLGPAGGAVGGVVVDPTGQPVAGAVVVVGEGEVAGIGGRDNLPPFGGLTRSDERGEFLVVGLAPGKQRIRARGARFAPWHGEVEVAIGTAADQRIELGAGAVLRGQVLDGAGKAVPRAEVTIGAWSDLVHYYTLTDNAGTFEMDGLPVGEFVVQADHDEHGKASTTVTTTLAAPTTCRLAVSRGLEMSGRVVDPEGQPVGTARIECMSEGALQDPWFVFTHTDAQGRFVAANRPETSKVTVTVTADGYEERVARGVDPADEPLLQLQRLPPPSVRITARFVDAEGRPLANAAAHGHRRGTSSRSYSDITDNDGRFELGPLPPGDWQLVGGAIGHPRFRSDWRTLAADVTWDLGTITLPRGGTARVHLVGEPIDDTRFVVSNATRSESFGVVTTADGPRSEVLAAGDYVLLVVGRAVAATAVPFTVRAGEEVAVAAPIEPANPQTFRCEVPAGSQVDAVTVLLFRGTTFVGRAWVDLKTPESSGALGLAPGDYRAVAEVGPLRGSASFTVGATSGPPVTIVLR